MFPAIGNPGDHPLTFASNTLQDNQLFVQAAPGAPVILRFTALTSGSYVINAAFTRIDTMDGAGDGVSAGVYSAGIGTISAAGEYIDLIVDAKDNFNKDGIGLSVTVAGVPEPATWAPIITGFGLIGAALRRRRSGFAAA